MMRNVGCQFLCISDASEKDFCQGGGLSSDLGRRGVAKCIQLEAAVTPSCALFHLNKNKTAAIHQAKCIGQLGQKDISCLQVGISNSCKILQADGLTLLLLDTWWSWQLCQLQLAQGWTCWNCKNSVLLSHGRYPRQCISVWDRSSERSLLCQEVRCVLRPLKQQNYI